MYSTLKLKCLIFASYFVVLITFSGFSYLISLLRHGTDPTSKTYFRTEKLSVATLKQVLDGRGVGYYGMFDKNEFVQRIKDTGHVSDEEVSDAVVLASQTIAEHFFATSSEFYVDVENTNDRAWLVQVITSTNHLLDNTLLPENVWKDIMKKLATSGVRTGTFDCLVDKKLCKRKKWNSPRLILALPGETRGKEVVIMHDYVMSNTAANVLHWVRKQLSEYVTEIHSNLDLKDWMTYTNKFYRPDIRVIMYHKLNEPCPLFLSSLAIKFFGQVSFASVHASKISLPSNIAQSAPDFPVYTVVRPEGILIYGHRRGENYNFKSMDYYLRSFELSESYIFRGLLFVVNAFAAMEIIFKFYSRNRTYFAVYSLCVMVKYNGALFLLWLVEGILHLQLFTNFILCQWRYLSGTCLGCLFRSCFKDSYSFGFHFIAFVVFAILADHVLKKRQWLEIKSPLTFDDWWQSYLQSHRSNSPEQSPSDYNVQEELVRLAIPDLWLPSGQSLELVKDLPVWKYQSWSGADEDAFNEDEPEEDLELKKKKNPSKKKAKQVSATKSLNLLEEQILNVFCMKECSICLGIFGFSEFLCNLPCGHIFHVNCAVSWLVDKNECPVCRCAVF